VENTAMVVDEHTCTKGKVTVGRVHDKEVVLWKNEKKVKVVGGKCWLEEGHFRERK